MDAYYKSARNLIDEGQFGAPIILTAFNYRKGQVHGIEFSTSYDRGPLSLYGNVAYSRAIGKDIVSSQFNFSAADLPTSASTASTWTTTSAGPGRRARPTRCSRAPAIPRGCRQTCWWAAGCARIRRRAGRAERPGAAGLLHVNLSAVQTIKTGYVGQTQLRLDVINVLDRKYEIRDGTGVGVGAPQFGLRRTILAGIAQKF